MSEDWAKQYRTPTGKMASLNMKNKLCKGCGRTRSIAQYKLREDEFCIRCVRRGNSNAKGET